MRLSELLAGAGIGYTPARGYEIEDIIYDSRKAAQGTVFVALRGFKSDGHDYMRAAYDAGCRVFVCERETPLPEDAVQICVPDSSVALADLSACFFGFPARKLTLIGITGTKGKTTTATLVREVLSRCGKKTGLIGTTGVYIGGQRYPTVNTTPESYKLHKYFAMMAESGVEYAVMEVSSQAYLRSRVHGITYDIGVFTNLSEDHIGPGECRDYDHYRECKGELFKNSLTSIINCDDPESGYFISRAQGKLITYGKSEKADLRADKIGKWKEQSTFGISFDAVWGGQTQLVKSRIPGDYSVYNLLAALAVCRECGISAGKAAGVLPDIAVRGRFEIVDALPYATAIIDFAHNEVSLRSVLTTVKEYEPERLVVLFGCVGGKSQVRRAGMGKVAAELADFAVLTSDDPDFEDPQKIIDEIAAGMEKPCPYESIPDRREAVRRAVALCRPGDVLLLAGKGHQDYDLVCGVKEPYDEREELLRAASEVLSAK